MTGHQYELFAAKYLKRHGFRNVKVTKASGDYGADIIAKKHGRRYAVQCKYYKGSVGLHAVQEVVAAKKHYNCSRAIVITNSFFTKPAIVLAKENSVILIPSVKPVFENPENILTKFEKTLLLFTILFSILIIVICILLFKCA